MTTQFNYLNKKYQVDTDATDWYNTPDYVVVKLPDGTLLEVYKWVNKNPRLDKVDFKILEATEVDERELTFQSILYTYKLPDNFKNRKLFTICCTLSGVNCNKFTTAQLDSIHRYWESLVDLIN